MTEPNSCPPERLFSMFKLFNATFGEDQKRSFGDSDYLELAMPVPVQSQYNREL